MSTNKELILVQYLKDGAMITKAMYDKAEEVYRGAGKTAINSEGCKVFNVGLVRTWRHSPCAAIVFNFEFEGILYDVFPFSYYVYKTSYISSIYDQANIKGKVVELYKFPAPEGQSFGYPVLNNIGEPLENPSVSANIENQFSKPIRMRLEHDFLCEK